MLMQYYIVSLALNYLHFLYDVKVFLDHARGFLECERVFLDHASYF